MNKDPSWQDQQLWKAAIHAQHYTSTAGGKCYPPTTTFPKQEGKCSSNSIPQSAFHALLPTHRLRQAVSSVRDCLWCETVITSKDIVGIPIPHHTLSQDPGGLQTKPFTSGNGQALLSATATFTSATCHSFLSHLKAHSSLCRPFPPMRAPHKKTYRWDHIHNDNIQMGSHAQACNASAISTQASVLEATCPARNANS